MESSLKEYIFNINHNVKLKITEKGFKHWQEYYNKCRTSDNIKKIIPYTTIEELKNSRDINGYSTMQLHTVMEIFGEDIHEHFFETNIKIAERDLKL